ncbi:unnamed protein product [Linum trigynum]|uniref:Uncharacterized protein n=1 Tax=Linum trigynum TaxID=586398 RepID=A0AAV2F9X6_9ROSI
MAGLDAMVSTVGWQRGLENPQALVAQTAIDTIAAKTAVARALSPTRSRSTLLCLIWIGQDRFLANNVLISKAFLCSLEEEEGKEKARERKRIGKKRDR